MLKLVLNNALCKNNVCEPIKNKCIKKKTKFWFWLDDGYLHFVFCSIFLVSVFKKTRKKVIFWKKDTVSLYCVIICLRANILNGGCRV